MKINDTFDNNGHQGDRSHSSQEVPLRDQSELQPMRDILAAFAKEMRWMNDGNSIVACIVGNATISKSAALSAALDLFPRYQKNKKLLTKRRVRKGNINKNLTRRKN